MLQEGVKEHIRSLSDEDLIEYAEDVTAGYTPDAIEFARQETQRRGLDGDRVQVLRQSIRAGNAEREYNVRISAQQPLGWLGRIILLVIGLPGPIVVIPLWLRFRELGERRKIRDMFVFALVGSAIQVAGIYFALPRWSWLAILQAPRR